MHNASVMQALDTGFTTQIIGLGIALAIGEAGATVIATGRSTRFGYRTEGRRETVEDTTEEITAGGGIAYPYICDHTDTKALQELASWLLRSNILEHLQLKRPINY